MAEAALGKTLDELIKTSKASKKPSKPKETKGGKSPAGKKSGAKGIALGVNKAGVGKKGQGNKGRGGGRAPQANPPRRNPDADGKWAHDMYRGAPARAAAQGGRSVFTLYISNLAFEVTEADLKELFSDYNYQKCYLNYDSSGRSVGKATVVFVDRGEALKAQKRYANMALDGLVMKLDLVEGPPSSKAGAMQLSSGLMLTTAKKGGRGGGKPAPGGRAFNKAFQAMETDSGGRGRRKPRGRGGRGGSRGGGGGRDLDTELDNYMQE